jgi:tripartite-type tricarboxylate transporter receptor subunit TctC
MIGCRNTVTSARERTVFESIAAGKRTRAINGSMRHNRRILHPDRDAIRSHGAVASCVSCARNGFIRFVIGDLIVQFASSHRSTRFLKTLCESLMGVVFSSSVTVCAKPAASEMYPAHPIRLIVSFAPGGSVDVVARIVGQRMSERFGQQVVIDNRPGAGGNLSAELAARAAPDGYTLYMSSASLVVNVSLYRRVGYDPLKDFAPVTLLASVQNVLVAHPSLPARTVPELIAFARKMPATINYASTGSGSSGHLAMELFKSMAGIDATHVPYKAAGQAQVDLIAGQVSLWFPTIPGALPFIKAAKMNALAVSGAARSPALPEVPTVAESGVKGFEASTWYPMLAPARTPAAVINKLTHELVAIVRAPQVREQLTHAGVEPIGSTAAELASHMQTELRKWAKVVQLAGVKLD